VALRVVWEDDYSQGIEIRLVVISEICGNGDLRSEEGKILVIKFSSGREVSARYIELGSNEQKEKEKLTESRC
jgi:hypothetical protein